jgi:PilZ domain-containing protein
MKLERAERRMDVTMAGRLAAVGSDPNCEWVSIKNISGHGARVISCRRWQVHEPVFLGETVGDQHLDAEVIYCQRLAGERYAVGLKFTSFAAAHDSMWTPRPSLQAALHRAHAR